MRIEVVPFRTTLVATAVLAALTGCGQRQGAAAPKVPVSVARVEQRSLPYELESNGTVEPIRSVIVLPQVNGTILRVHFAEGDEVSAGQILFEIDPRPYQAALLCARDKPPGSAPASRSTVHRHRDPSTRLSVVGRRCALVRRQSGRQRHRHGIAQGSLPESRRVALARRVRENYARARHAARRGRGAESGGDAGTAGYLCVRGEQ